MKLFASILTTLFLTFAVAPAMAGSMSLLEAKSAGLIGEKQDGLVAAVLPNPSGDIQQLVNSTNSGRMAVYKDMAAKQNIPLDDVRKIAAQKIFGLAASGDYLFTDNGWVRK